MGFLLAFESPLNANITANITQTPTPAVAALSAPETISAQASPVATPTPPAQAESPITQATLEPLNHHAHHPRCAGQFPRRS
ncbi:MAG: hypothetical protein R2865_07815 [Deinococcales bacterium]